MTQTASNPRLAALALQKAITQLGQRETSPNSGKMIDLYLKSVGLGAGYAWCQAFVYWCYQQAAFELGISNPVYHTAGVMANWNNTTAEKYERTTLLKIPTLVKPGDQMILNYGKGLGHTGIIERVEGLVLHTIEGNSNNDGSREGVEVVRHTRRLDSPLLQGIISY